MDPTSDTAPAPEARSADLVGDPDGWPQLSELDLDVCLSAGLPRERDDTRRMDLRSPRPQA
jgi:hypothetical protein